MAGGMGRGNGRTLAERSGAATSPSPSRPDPEPLVAALPEVGPGQVRRVVTRHCWVTGLPDCPGQWAGLLSEWHQDPAGRWAGRVVYIVEEAGQPVLIEAWVPAAHLSPLR